MKKLKDIFNKFTSSIISIVLIGSNFMPVLAYATNQMSQNEDILFDVTINNEHSYTASLDEKLTLEFNLSVQDGGYIKDGSISISDNNYKIGDIQTDINEKEVKNLKQNDSGKMEIGQVNSGNPLNFELPIEFGKQDLMENEYFNKESKVQLKANYINDAGEEKKISKEVSLNVKWDEEAQGYINQELKRYLKYDNKTLISFLITDGIQDNKLPQLNKVTQVLVPKIADEEPSKIIVTGDYSDYIYENQVLAIKSPDEFTWNSANEYLVTYIYDNQMDETTLSTVALNQIKTINDKTIETKTDETSFEVKDEIGNLLETSIKGVDELSKGYLYTNLNREDKLETSFEQNYQINIGLVDFLDEIKVSENEENTVTRKVTVDKEELIKILGEDGSIKVLDKDNSELGILNKDNLELNVDKNSLQYITSKPIQEGNININLNKVINPNMEYTKESLSELNEIENNIDIIGNYQGNEISNNHLVKKFNLVEPSSNATISINQSDLSTVVKNEDVVITATLERNDISDALYTNPELLITLPNQITSIELKDAKLLYDDELKPADFRTEENKIYLRLEGTQTEYSSIPTANGSVIKIVADLGLDNLAVNSNEKIILEYTNPERNEIKSVETPIQIVAPTGFVIANSAMQAKNSTAINSDEVFQIAANDVEKQITLKGTVVSNLENNGTGVLILGRVPAQETKSVDGLNNDLESTYTTNIKTPISVEGIDADIYYSENGSASFDLSNSDNGWTQEFNTNAKSYLIVAKSEVTPAQKIDFSYDINVPSNIDYENRAISIFAVYYDNNDSEDYKNIIVSRKINIDTENIPIIKTTITASDYYSGNVINYGDNIGLGSYVKYTINATNDGKKAAENVKVKIGIPAECGVFYEMYDEESEFYDSDIYTTSEITREIERIEAGETKQVEIVLYISSTAEIGNNIVIRPEVTADNMADMSTAIYENTVADGNVSIKMSTMVLKSEYEVGNEIEYNLEINDNSMEGKKNLEIEIDIPKYIEIKDSKEGEYNQNERKLRFKIEEINVFKYLTFTAEVVGSDEPNQEISLTAIGRYDDQETKSNTVTRYVKDTKGINVNVSSNIEGKMIDTDTVEYYIEVENASKKEAEINIYDELPKELKIEKYILRNGNNVIEENVSLSPSIIEKVSAGSSIKVTIVAKPYRLNLVEETKEIENKVSVKANGLDVGTNSIKQEIEGTSNFNTEIAEEENVKEEKNTYGISGRVWYDKNKNGKQDDEEVIKGVEIKLYNVNKSEYVKDNEGKEKAVITKADGEYSFENLEKGQYIVIAKYDEDKYKIVNYQENGLNENEDNDFVQAEKGMIIKEDKTATTNIITIKEKNLYNIDLGLVDQDKFYITANNKISKVTILNGEKSKVYEGEDIEKSRIDIAEKDKAIAIIEYTIEVKNEGNIDGYAKEIRNEIPEGMNFISELNKDWYENSKGEVVSRSLSNKVIKQGEKEELKLIVTKELNENDKELIHSTAEIRETYNEYGIKEINAKAGQVVKADGIADILIVRRDVLKETVIMIFLSVTIIGALSLLGVGIYKRVREYV